MQVMLALCASCALGCALTSCALPSVVLGGRVSFNEARGELERTTVRSALWVAVSYSARAQAEVITSERAAPSGAFEARAVPCAFDVACAWEREAAYEASWGGTPRPPQHESVDEVEP